MKPFLPALAVLGALLVSQGTAASPPAPLRPAPAPRREARPFEAQPVAPQPERSVLVLPPSAASALLPETRFPEEFEIPASSRDTSVPSPVEFLGYSPGDSLTPPESLQAYARAVAAKSRKVRVEGYGSTPEGRPLSLVFISSPANLARLEEFRQTLRTLASGSPGPDAARRLTTGMPAFVWVACSIHGDEPGGGEAGLALLHWLSASEDEAVASLLDRLVVILDPDANPDGRARHVAWWRTVAGSDPDEDPEGLENSSAWPDGRTNHNLFDLNRDWAWASQPETRARIKAFLLTPPQVYVDLHEMTPEASYFFPPDAEPVHPNVAPEIRKWVERFGRANAKAFDQRGWSYFVRESFDRFYPGYGDSWPSFHGAAGMTYEVAGGVGLSYRRKDSSLLTLKERVVKHFTSVRTTLETAASGREELLADFASFFRRPSKEGQKAFVVPAGQDPGRLRRLARLLTLQGISVETTAATVKNFPRTGQQVPEGSLVIDTFQPLGRFAETLLEPSAELSEDFLREERRRLLQEEPDHFFDVTAWSLPIAFGLEAFSTAEKERLGARKPFAEPARPASPNPTANYGWLLPGGDSSSLSAAGRLMERGIRIGVLTRESRLGERRFVAGSFLIRKENNSPAVSDIIWQAAKEAQAEVVPLNGAWTDGGAAFGSRSVVPLKTRKVLVLGGEGVNSNGFGSVLLSLREHLGIRPMRRTPSTLADGDLSGVRVIIVPHGSGAFQRELEREETASRLRRFVEEGGIVIGIRGGAEILREKPLSLSSVKAWEPARKDSEGPEVSTAETQKKPPAKTAPSQESTDPVVAALESHLSQRVLAIPGAALRTEGLLSHPLLYGLASAPPFLVSGGRAPLPLASPLSNVLRVKGKDPLASGFAWKEALEPWTGAPLVQIEEVGKGRVISFSADPVFRGVWAGSEIVFLNAVLFSDLL
ncbi:MAG: hypothetical protein IT186_01125 [Acidobacteria bacterium]|nr:hypothetical protein [Acidobacteriota bacterium]